MAYITPADLLVSPGAEELAQRAVAEHVQPISAELLIATVDAADRSNWSAVEIAVADDALARINSAIGEAEELVNGSLRAGGYTVPLSPVPTLIKLAMRRVVRRLLAKDADEKSGVERDYQDALKLLRSIGKREIQLGVDAIPAPTSQNSVSIVQGARAFDDTSLANY